MLNHSPCIIPFNLSPDTINVDRKRRNEIASLPCIQLFKKCASPWHSRCTVSSWKVRNDGMGIKWSCMNQILLFSKEFILNKLKQYEKVIGSLWDYRHKEPSLSADWALALTMFLYECHLQFFMLAFSLMLDPWPLALPGLLPSCLYCQNIRWALSLDSFQKKLPEKDSDWLGLGHMKSPVTRRIQEQSSLWEVYHNSSLRETRQTMQKNQLSSTTHMKENVCLIHKTFRLGWKNKIRKKALQ